MDYRKYREYDFPSAWVRVYPDRTCREFPKFCMMLSVERSRSWTAEALRSLRGYQRASMAGLDHAQARVAIGLPAEEGA